MYNSLNLSFAALRAANIARLPLFKNKHGQPAHSEPDGSDWSPAQWLQAVVGELGEYANLAKKYDRGDLSQTEFYREACDELADVQCYLDILAFQLGIDLGAATLSKWNRVSERVGCDIRLAATPAPLADAELAELVTLAENATLPIVFEESKWPSLATNEKYYYFSDALLDAKGGLIGRQANYIAAACNALPGLLARLATAEDSLPVWLPIYPGCKLPELNAEWGNWVALLNNYGEAAQQPRFGRLCGDDEDGLFWHLDNQEAWAFESFTHYYPLAVRPSTHDTVNRKALAEAAPTVKGGQPNV